MKLKGIDGDPHKRWSDLGTWGSLLLNSTRDIYGNATVGQSVRASQVALFFPGRIFEKTSYA